MKCPRCSRIATAPVASCPGCGFSLARIESSFAGDAPAPGPLDDRANLLDEAERRSLEAAIASRSGTIGGEIVVVIRTSTAPLRPAEYAFGLANYRGLGGPARRGVLVLLVLGAQHIETELGAAWDTPALERATGRVLEERVVPRLRERAWAGALHAAVDGLAEAILAETAATPGGAR